MLTRLFPILLALAVAIGVLAELAFTRTKTYTLAAAPTEADTTIVTVTGRVTPAAPNNYILSDSTGQVELETCPTWYRPVRLRPNERVTVTGEIYRNSTPPKGMLYTLAAYTIARQDRPEIVLRTGPGKPPWALSTSLPR